MSFTPITITATGLTGPDGEPARGILRAQLESPMKNDGQVADGAEVVATITGGALVAPLTLYANDNAGTTPNGAYYKFTLQIDGAPRLRFDAVVHADAPDGTVGLADLVPTVPSYVPFIDGGQP